MVSVGAQTPNLFAFTNWRLRRLQIPTTSETAPPEADFFESRGHRVISFLSIVPFFGLGGKDISDRFEQPAIIKPIDPFQGGVLDGLEVSPRSASMDDLGLVPTFDRLGEGVVAAADRGLEAGLGQSFAVFDREVLHAPIAVMNEAAASNGSAIVQRLLQRVEHEAGMGRARGAPAHDPTRECVDDERDVDEALPSGDVGEVRDPQRVRPGAWN